MTFKLKMFAPVPGTGIHHVKHQIYVEESLYDLWNVEFQIHSNISSDGFCIFQPPNKLKLKLSYLQAMKAYWGCG